jgi:hypothetical protein
MKLLLSVFAAIAAIALAPHSAQASSYSNTSGLTQLTINELTGPNRGKGSYITRIGATNWSGTFTPTSNGITNGGMTTYLGTFVDKPMTTGSTVQCSGTIKLDQTLVAGKLNLSVKWVVTGGVGCPFVGTPPTTLLLKESLPIANTSGDFTPSNSTTRFIPVNSRDIWPKWKVVDPTGLNCRATPGGVIVANLPVSTVVSTTIFHSNGQWLRRSPSSGPTCYIRANSTYIKPVQLPF